MPNADPFTAVLVMVGAVIVGIIGYFGYNLTRTKVTRKARVISKHKEPGMSTATCTFEFEDGRRQEYDVTIDTYGSLSVNEVGYLVTKGAVLGIPTGRLDWRRLIPEEPMTQIKEALFRGRKIDAIRQYRESTGAGLAEAKAAVEQMEAELRTAEPDRFGGPGGD